MNAASMQISQLIFWISGAAAFIVAAVGGAASWLKYWRELEAREWDRAHQAYERFLDVAIAHPEFVSGYWSKASLTAEQRNKFRWFMARFLWAAEQALLRVPDRREEWASAIGVVLREHADYLSCPSTEAEVRCYYGPIADLIRDSVRSAGDELPSS